MYSAIVARVHTRPHPKADRLQLGTVAGHQVVVGLGTQDGELGVFFPADGQLSEQMVRANNLYSEAACRKLGIAVEEGSKFGFFSERRRVRAQSFRGEKSDGFWVPLSYLAWAKHEEFSTLGTLHEGYTFTELNGHPICNKYETEATKRARNSGKVGKCQRDNICFPKHSDTVQFRFVADKIPANAVCYITEKLHGTSGRYGLVLDDNDLSFFQRGLNWAMERCGIPHPFPSRGYRYLNGSRNVILEKSTGAGFYGTNAFRERAVEGLTLHKGEVLYFELVGSFDDGRGPRRIMDAQPIKDELKELKKTYGEYMTYNYGCYPGQTDLYVYKIVRMNEDGLGVELSWPQMVQRCGELGLKHVPLLCGPFTPAMWEDLPADQQQDKLRNAVEHFTDGPSTLDPTHIREGVVLRVESPEGTQHIKNKSWTFGVLEGYIKDSDTYVDTEEAA